MSNLQSAADTSVKSQTIIGTAGSGNEPLFVEFSLPNADFLKENLSGDELSAGTDNLSDAASGSKVNAERHVARWRRPVVTSPD